jgi:imidazoleglycerol-phosphate dehydratase
MREATVTRKTKETNIELKLNLDGRGIYKIDTGIPFLNHMLELFSKHGFFDLELKATGDLAVDCHHTMEDVGLVLGQALADALGDKTGIKRYGFFVLPMDETRVTVTLDLSGRPYLVYDVEPPNKNINNIDVHLFHEFFQALAVKAGMNLHMVQNNGGETHHVIEAVFKAFAKALDTAVSFDTRLKDDVLSTKGILI